MLSWLLNYVSKNLLGGITYASNEQIVWQDLGERFTKIDGSKIFNLHKKVAIYTHGTNSVSMYFSRLKDLREEFEALFYSLDYSCDKLKGQCH